MTMRYLWIIIAAVIIGVAAWYFLLHEEPASAGILKPNDEALVSHGEEIYAAKCASCHGRNLQGQEGWEETRADGKRPAPPHDVTGETWKFPEQVLFGVVKFGAARMAGGRYKSNMHSFKNDLTDEEIIAVLSFIKSTWPADIRRQNDEITEFTRRQGPQSGEPKN